MKDLALLISGIIFLIVSLLHLCRLIFKLEAKMGRFTIPQWVSIFGFTAPMLFALWIFSLLR
ncbi:MAG: hypothetical protein V1840_03490 [Candidatus Omnitrophota bacterium]